MTNFPPPSGVADEIIVKAIACLDAGEWDHVDEYHITIRTVRIGLQTVNIVIPLTDVDILKYGKPSAPYREAFQEAYKAAMARERERRMAPLMARMSDAAAARARSRDRWKRVATRTVMAMAALTAVLIVGVGLVSCSDEATRRAKAEEARAGEVNKYGYERGGFRPSFRFTYPDSCDTVTYGDGRHFASDYECKRIFGEWEERGEVWVDWKAEP